MFTPKLKLEHADKRGEIYSIEFADGQELMLLHSTPGVFRGGHSHTVDEVVTILSGKMVYHKVVQGRETQEMVGPGDSSVNKAGQIHMGEFLEDTWLIEYKMGTKKGEWENRDYEPYRGKVRASSQT